MAHDFIGKRPNDAIMAAFYRFLRNYLNNGNMAEIETLGKAGLHISEVIRSHHRALETINWPSQEESDLDDQDSSVTILGRERIAESITADHDLFAVETLFVEDQGEEVLAQDANRGRYLLERFLIPKADVTCLPFDKENLDQDGIDIRISIEIPLSDSIMDNLLDQEISFDQMIDHAIRLLNTDEVDKKSEK